MSVKSYRLTIGRRSSERYYEERIAALESERDAARECVFGAPCKKHENVSAYIASVRRWKSDSKNSCYGCWLEARHEWVEELERERDTAICARNIMNDAVRQLEAENAELREEDASLRDSYERYIKQTSVEVERLRREVSALDKLLACYRLGKRPSEKLLDELATLRDGKLREGKP